jgi:hypothetical protein
MALVMIAGLLGASLFGGLGIWAGELIVTVVVAPFGASLFAAVAALFSTTRHQKPPD